MTELKGSVFKSTEDLKKFNAQKRLLQIQVRREQLLKDPIKEYVEFVIKKISDILHVSVEEIINGPRTNRILQARFYAIEFVSYNTALGADVMYFFNKDRTTFYNTIERVEDFKKSYLEKIQYQKLVEACTMSSFTRAKDETKQ